MRRRGRPGRRLHRVRRFSGSPAATSSGHKVSGGNITFAEVPGAPPNYIFPMDSLAYYSTNNLAQFQYLMWRPLYWIGDHSQIVVNQPLSLAAAPVYSRGNTVVTINLKHYLWSDGKPVTSRDVVFWINLLKANKVNWGEYAPGFFPDDVTKVAAPSSSQVVLTLNGPVNPQWFTESELTQISPLPQHAWDKTSATGKIGNYDTSTSGARAVYKFLASESTQLRTYATNPLWQVVDGPWKLSSFSPSGLAKFVPNSTYSGPVKASAASFTEVPYTSESAEYDALRAGQLSYGYVPFTDVAQKGLIQSQGYQVAPWYLWSMNIIPINFHNPTVGHLFQQLYVRQAMQSLIDQRQYVSAVLHGNGAVDNGPVPTLPQTDFLTPLLRQGPYPYSVARAKSLLSQHGWTVKPGGTSTCAKPGSGSGRVRGGHLRRPGPVHEPRVQRGPARSQPGDAGVQIGLSLVGIQLNLSQQPTGDIFSTITPCSPSAAACKWQMAYWGNGWEFAPDYYPSGEVAFSTGAIGNWGSYSDATMDSKIKATTTQPGSTVFQDWANFTAQQLPMLFMPLSASQISAIKTSLGGAAPQPSAGLPSPRRAGTSPGDHLILRRLWHSLLVVIGVTIVTFILLHLLPGGPARAILGPRATPAAIAVFNRVNGFDQPIYVQYWDWIVRLVHGNLGYSYKLNQSVASLIADRLPKTILLVGLANLAALIIAVPLGLLQASRRNKAFDYAVTGGAFIFYSMPLFWLSLLLVIVFSIDLRWFPPEAPQGDLTQVLADPAGLVLPVASLTLITVALFSRYMRSSAIDSLTQDYVRTAQAKGVSEARLLRKHILRNSLLPTSR